MLKQVIVALVVSASRHGDFATSRLELFSLVSHFGLDHGLLGGSDIRGIHPAS